jgi:hypothetical protein
MQLDKFSYSSLLNAIKQIYAQEGIKAFYSGLGIGMIVIKLSEFKRVFLCIMVWDFSFLHWLKRKPS